MNFPCLVSLLFPSLISCTFPPALFLPLSQLSKQQSPALSARLLRSRQTTDLPEGLYLILEILHQAYHLACSPSAYYSSLGGKHYNQINNPSKAACHRLSCLCIRPTHDRPYNPDLRNWTPFAYTDLTLVGIGISSTARCSFSTKTSSQFLFLFHNIGTFAA